MKRFFMKYGFAVLATATVVAVALSLMTFLSNHINVLENAAGTVAAPFRSAAAFVADWIDDQLRYVEDFDELRRENKELRRQIAEMEEQLRQAQEDSEENQRLRELLDLRERRRDLSDFETATVIERSVSNWSAVMTLSKGASSGVEEGDCVLSSEGYLVGFITKVGSSWSTLQTLVDTDASMGAQVFRSGDIAVAEGDRGHPAGGGPGGHLRPRGLLPQRRGHRLRGGAGGGRGGTGGLRRDRPRRPAGGAEAGLYRQEL